MEKNRSIYGDEFETGEVYKQVAWEAVKGECFNGIGEIDRNEEYYNFGSSFVYVKWLIESRAMLRAYRRIIDFCEISQAESKAKVKERTWDINKDEDYT